ncbi:MAG: hypothetical protein CMJ18_09505 [Phycisphaeraceae bacterium]|nr:hypothetical protein [Phycisphaeraceae bacterium]
MHGFEALKLVRSRRPLIGLAASALFLVLMLVGFYTYAQTETGGRADFRYTFENRSYFNGLTFALYAFYFGVLMVLPIFASTEGGTQIAGETSGRTLGLLLTRPVARSRILRTKLVVSGLYLLLLSGALLAAALTIGLIAVGWGDLNIYPGVLQMTDRHQHLDQATALRAFVIAWPAASIGLLAPLALSTLLSTWMDNPINAVAAAVAIHLVLYVTGEIHFFRDLRPFLYTSYMGYWRGVFREEVDWGAVSRDGAKLLAFSFGFLAVAAWRFRIRQET